MGEPPNREGGVAWEQVRAEAVRIVEALRAAGHVAYLAGGCVRDELLGLQPKDYDVATDAPPARVREVVPGAHENPVGRQFGVMLVRGARARGVVTEVATFRREWGYSDARRPDGVAFSDAREDALRRDFTINAMFLDPAAGEERWTAALDGGRVRGEVIDYVGGLGDLRAGLVRAVGEPAERLREDHLRALRAVRFAARLGFAMEPGTAAAVASDAASLTGVSRERVGDELRRMFAHGGRVQAAEWMQHLGLTTPVLGAGIAGESGGEAAGNWRHLRAIGAVIDGAGPAGFGCAVAAWVRDLGWSARLEDERGRRELVRGGRASLCLSNEEASALEASVRWAAWIRERWSAAGVAERKRAAAGAWFEAALALVGAEHAERAAAVRRERSDLETDGIGLAPEPLITGDTLIRAGYRPGPRFKRALDAAYDAQLEGRCLGTAEALSVAEAVLSDVGAG